MTDAVSNPLLAMSMEALQDLIVRQVPQNLALDLRLLEFSPGRLVLEMPYQQHLLADESGSIHEGAITTLIDTGCGAVVLTRIEEFRRPATLDLRVDYRRASRPGAVIRCEAACEHITDHIALVRAIAHDGDAADPLAIAVGSFAVFKSAAAPVQRS